MGGNAMLGGKGYGNPAVPNRLAGGFPTTGGNITQPPLMQGNTVSPNILNLLAQRGRGMIPQATNNPGLVLPNGLLGMRRR